MYLVGAATRELAFEYHDKGYIALEANLRFEDGKTISFSQGGNTVTAEDEESGFSEEDIGKYIYTGDGWHKILSVSDVTIVGCGKNLYDVNDRLWLTDGVTVDADGWITVTADNSAGSSNIFENCYTYPSLAIRPSTQYTVICEIAQINVTGQIVFSIVDLFNDLHRSQFAQAFSLTVNENTQTGTRIQVMASRADPSDAGTMLRTYVAFNPGASGTIKFRLSVLEDTDITAETFVYEPYEDIPYLALDNAQGQIGSVAVEAGCRTRQAGTGDPSPTNIRAISGRESVEVTACGKNLFEAKQDVFNGSPTPISTLASDQTTSMLLEELGNDQYVFAFDLETHDLVFADDADDLRKRIGIEGYATQADGTNVYLNSWASVANGKLSANTTARIVSVWQREAGEYISTEPMYLYAQNMVSGTWSVSNIQLELGSTATAFEPYRSMGGGVITPSEPLYGLPGAEDTVEVSVDGDVTVTRRTGIYAITGAEAWTAATSAANTYYFDLINTGGEITTQVLKPGICSHYKTAQTSQIGAEDKTFQHLDYSSIRRFLFRDDSYATVDAWKAYLAAQKTVGTPVTIVYELAAPTTETPADVDPIEPQIGEVNVFTDADS